MYNLFGKPRNVGILCWQLAQDKGLNACICAQEMLAWMSHMGLIMSNVLSPPAKLNTQCEGVLMPKAVLLCLLQFYSGHYRHEV